MKGPEHCVECVLRANAVLGESPSWDASEGVLYWVDGEHPSIFRFDPKHGQTGHWLMPSPVGCVALAEDKRLILADAQGLGFFDLRNGTTSRIADPESGRPKIRLNDGKVDRSGRFWVGSMDTCGVAHAGSLYCLDPDLSIHCMAMGFACSNGIGWSPDNQTMYYTDSIARTIFCCAFDLSSGAMGAQHVFAQLPSNDGLPDGLTVDREGFVWSAIWDGWRLIRYAPDGSIDREVRLPVQRPTSCMFGGSDLKTLYVTSASVQLDAQALQGGPLAGALFALQTDVPGLPEPTFAC